jgi:hypothetical protein
MIRILIDHNVVCIPIPSIDIGHVVRSDAPIPVVEPETVGVSAAKAPHVPRTESTFIAPMLPGTFDMIVAIITAAVVTYPYAPIYMRRIGMTGLIGIMAPVMILITMILITMVLIPTVLVTPILIAAIAVLLV